MVQSLFKAMKSQPEWMVRPEAEQLYALNKLLRLWHSRMNGILVYEASQVLLIDLLSQIFIASKCLEFLSSVLNRCLDLCSVFYYM